MNLTIFVVLLFCVEVCMFVCLCVCGSVCILSMIGMSNCFSEMMKTWIQNYVEIHFLGGRYVSTGQVFTTACFTVIALWGASVAQW